MLEIFRIRKTAIVRTLHNIQPHEPGTNAEKRVVAELDRRTDIFVSLTAATKSPRGPAIIIPHGHYKESYSEHPTSVPVEGRIGFVGLIRPYKGIENLIKAFRGAETQNISLRIAGKPTDELKEEICRDIATDPRISAKLDYLPDCDFVKEVTSATLICLPGSNVHNSGTLLAALSLDRPVLAKRTPTTCEISDEVGPGWVHLFDGELSSADIDDALRSLKESGPHAAPKFAARDWRSVASMYGEVFRDATKRSRRP